MGNAYYKLNKIAESIYYYEKALLLAPNDQEIKTNLSYAQNMTWTL
ncbi:tetratricopeptide repeat protein [Maribacter confluentis]|uniref:Tetratricopeptide repeat protein n=1 Tax=Maribacter confluentis TaxID=1656093 RepID=A0ABT8RYP0_9FLAO|nr:tetratricopeptide repeat protein [Maribacter confluentis]MDO1514771.1 tetratricopeptide repeat protein [Maribacter confluentis]